MLSVNFSMFLSSLCIHIQYPEYELKSKLIYLKYNKFDV